MEQLMLGVYMRKAFALKQVADVYAVVKTAGKSFKTSAGNDTKEVVFDELFLLPVTANDTLDFKLVDDQKFRKDPILGRGKVTVAEVLEDRDKWFGSLKDAGGEQQLPVVDICDASGEIVGKIEVEIFSEVKNLEQLSVLCCTWNVGNAQPPEDLRDWLRGTQEGEHHVVAVAAQECKYQSGEGKDAKTGPKDGAGGQDESGGMDGVHSTVQFGGDEPSTPDGASGAPETKDKLFVKLQHKLQGTSFEWERHVNKAIGNKYWLYEAVNMGQIRLLVFVRVDIITAIDQDAKCEDTEATGIGNVVSNKGGVGIGMRIFGTDLTFISAHLAAHQDKSAARNKDYREIIKGVDLDPYHSDPATSPHYSFFMGDLNYRIDYGEQAKTFAESPTLEDWNSLVATVEKGEFGPLLAEDQLQKQMAAGQVLSGFQEAPITFRPTFKVIKKHPPGATGDQYYTTKRSPAWCDRVLVKPTLPHLQPAFGEYFSSEAIVTSDHKPVGCVVTVPTARSTLLGLRAGGPKDQLPQYELVISDLSSKGEWLEMAQAYDELRMIVNGTAVVRGQDVDLSPAASGRGKGTLRKGDAKVVLLPGGFDKMADDRVLIKIEGLVASSTSFTLGTAVLPLGEVAKAGGASTAFSVPVYQYGIGPVAHLEGSVKLVECTHRGEGKKSFFASVKAKFKK